MRFILIILMTATMLSCKDDMEHRLKGGMVITVKGAVSYTHLTLPTKLEV